PRCYLNSSRVLLAGPPFQEPVTLGRSPWPAHCFNGRGLGLLPLRGCGAITETARAAGTVLMHCPPFTSWCILYPAPRTIKGVWRVYAVSIEARAGGARARVADDRIGDYRSGRRRR